MKDRKTLAFSLAASMYDIGESVYGAQGAGTYVFISPRNR